MTYRAGGLSNEMDWLSQFPGHGQFLELGQFFSRSALALFRLIDLGEALQVACDGRSLAFAQFDTIAYV